MTHQRAIAAASVVADRVEAELIEALRCAPNLALVEAARASALRFEPLAPAHVVDQITRRVVANLSGMGELAPFLEDPSVTELMVSKGQVWVERHGRIEPVPDVQLTDAAVLRIVERIIAPLGLQLDRAHPMVDARLPDGSRLNVVIPPLAIDGPCLTVRRFAARCLSLHEFTKSPATSAFINESVHSRQNLLVSGSTGSGKTTLLNTLGSICAHTDRIVTIEDAAELRLPGPHIVRLEARPGAPDGSGRVTIRDLVRNALRMRPDRIIIGEVRGGEAFDMVTALNTGHDGSMTTIHANSATDALRRLELMMLLAGIELPLAAVREQIGSAIHRVVHVSRTTGGRRTIVAVGTVCLIDGRLSVTEARSEVDGSSEHAHHPHTAPFRGDRAS